MKGLHPEGLRVQAQDLYNIAAQLRLESREHEDKATNLLIDRELLLDEARLKLEANQKLYVDFDWQLVQADKARRAAVKAQKEAHKLMDKAARMEKRNARR